MNEFTIKFFISNKDVECIEIIDLNNTELEPWKSDIEAKALSEYYNQKIKIENQKISL